MHFRPVLSNWGPPDTTEACRLLIFTLVERSAKRPRSQSETQSRVKLSVSHHSISRTHEEEGLKVSVVSNVTGSYEAEPRDKKWVRSGDLKHV